MTLSTNDYHFWHDLAPWDLFGSDIILEVHHILTEPVCPTVKVRFDIPKRAGQYIIAYGCGNTIDEAIQSALEKAKVELERLVKEKQNV